MVNGDYVRLSAACHCGVLLPKRLGRGRPRKVCAEHGKKPEAKWSLRKCPGCMLGFTPVKYDQIYCSVTCGSRVRRGCRPKGTIDTFECGFCKSIFKATQNAKYCNKLCKVKAFKAQRPGYDSKYRPAPLPQEVKDQRAKERVERNKLLKVATAKLKQENRERDLAIAREHKERLHRQDAKVVSCEECGIQFCPLYKMGSPARLCECCKVLRTKASRASSHAIRKARERASVVELVNPYRVFHTAGWKCKICGVDTPRSKRGSYDDDAPELDHIKPLAKGGEHSYANTQCACRKCNAKKSDSWQSEPSTPIALPSP